MSGHRTPDIVRMSKTIFFSLDLQDVLFQPFYQVYTKYCITH